MALLAKHTTIHTLRLSSSSLARPEDWPGSNTAEASSAVFALQSLEYTGLTPSAREVQVLREILRSAKDLRSLSVEQPFCRSRSRADMRAWSADHLSVLSGEVLLASSFSKLTSLGVMHAVFAESELFEALGRCKLTLARLTLRHVALLQGDREWKRIAQTMLAMPALLYVELVLWPAVTHYFLGVGFALGVGGMRVY